MSGKIFISYRREDEPAEARSIRDRLVQSFGDEATFMDVDNLDAGAHFGRELDAALNECAAFIAIIGPRWHEILENRNNDKVDDYVVAEISSALTRDILIVPTLVRNAKLPNPEDLPPSISDLAFRQAHTISHEKFSSDVSELVRVINDKVKIRNPKPSVLRKYGYWVAGLALVLLLVSSSFFSYHYFGTQNVSKSQLRVFTHDEGLTNDVAEILRNEFTSSEVNIVISEHVDRRRPDAIYISENAPIQMVRQILDHIYGGITHIFPVDYSTKSSIEMKGVTIAVGLMSDFEYYSENSAEKPYRISQSQISWLVEKGLDQATFEERLIFIAPARKRSN